MVKVADQQQADKQRKKKNIKKKLPSLNFNSNVPVAPELLQNDYVGSNRWVKLDGIEFCQQNDQSSRASHGYTSNSSPLLLYGQTISDSESESVYELRRSLAPTPTKSKLIVEKPKPVINSGRILHLHVIALETGKINWILWIKFQTVFIVDVAKCVVI